MMGLPEKIVLIHETLSRADIPHAFGGALALAWCTLRARGTIDIDINIFVTTDESEHVFNSLPSDVSWSDSDLKVIIRDGQVRLWWDQVPLDIFLNTTELHAPMAKRCRWESFMGESIPFLSCIDLALFKVFFNRTKDWADLEEMQAAGTLNVNAITAIIIEHLGIDDERIEKLTNLAKNNTV